MITLQKIWVKAVSVVMLLSAFAVSAGGYGYKKNKDIVDVAASNQSFTTLVAAVKAAGLVDTLKGKGPYTVFAPTNEAFAKLPAGTVESLLKPENKDKLIAILTYHVVPSKFYAKQVVNIDAAKTVQGSSIDITAMNGKVMVDNAKVIKTDIKASNGVIHVIDNVIIPSDKATVARHH
ncbi:fasciclin domain-containing protein [Thalassotalea euphylliae]|uniref:Fasciclin domain-containing protein n=1 Tax=Thalassotalea euphylliae TaxID=1655234 RepID=A0A3E0U7T8_9GAMM|nr:fasciclin domain-containing protein [Thalassotalea euphylliae]